eukprot:g2024.t1
MCTSRSRAAAAGLIAVFAPAVCINLFFSRFLLQVDGSVHHLPGGGHQYAPVQSSQTPLPQHWTHTGAAVADACALLASWDSCPVQQVRPASLCGESGCCAGTSDRAAAVLAAANAQLVLDRQAADAEHEEAVRALGETNAALDAMVDPTFQCCSGGNIAKCGKGCGGVGCGACCMLPLFAVETVGWGALRAVLDVAKGVEVGLKQECGGWRLREVIVRGGVDPLKEAGARVEGELFVTDVEEQELADVVRGVVPPYVASNDPEALALTVYGVGGPGAEQQQTNSTSYGTMPPLVVEVGRPRTSARRPGRGEGAMPEEAMPDAHPQADEMVADHAAEEVEDEDPNMESERTGNNCLSILEHKWLSLFLPQLRFLLKNVESEDTIPRFLREEQTEDDQGRRTILLDLPQPPNKARPHEREAARGEFWVLSFGDARFSPLEAVEELRASRGDRRPFLNSAAPTRQEAESYFQDLVKAATPPATSPLQHPASETVEQRDHREKAAASVAKMLREANKRLLERVLTKSLSAAVQLSWHGCAFKLGDFFTTLERNLLDAYLLRRFRILKSAVVPKQVLEEGDGGPRPGGAPGGDVDDVEPHGPPRPSWRLVSEFPSTLWRELGPSGAFLPLPNAKATAAAMTEQERAADEVLKMGEDDVFMCNISFDLLEDPVFLVELGGVRKRSVVLSASLYAKLEEYAAQAQAVEDEIELVKRKPDGQSVEVRIPWYYSRKHLERWVRDTGTHPHTRGAVRDPAGQIKPALALSALIRELVLESRGREQERQEAVPATATPAARLQRAKQDALTALGGGKGVVRAVKLQHLSLAMIALADKLFWQTPVGRGHYDNFRDPEFRSDTPFGRVLQRSADNFAAEQQQQLPSSSTAPPRPTSPAVTSENVLAEAALLDPRGSHGGFAAALGAGLAPGVAGPRDQSFVHSGNYGAEEWCLRRGGVSPCCWPFFACGEAAKRVCVLECCSLVARQMQDAVASLGFAEDRFQACWEADEAARKTRARMRKQAVKRRHVLEAEQEQGVRRSAEEKAEELEIAGMPESRDLELLRQIMWGRGTSTGLLFADHEGGGIQSQSVHNEHRHVEEPRALTFEQARRDASLYAAGKARPPWEFSRSARVAAQDAVLRMINERIHVLQLRSEEEAESRSREVVLSPGGLASSSGSATTASPAGLGPSSTPGAGSSSAVSGMQHHDGHQHGRPTIVHPFLSSKEEDAPHDDSSRASQPGPAPRAPKAQLENERAALEHVKRLLLGREGTTDQSLSTDCCGACFDEATGKFNPGCIGGCCCCCCLTTDPQCQKTALIMQRTCQEDACCIDLGRSKTTLVRIVVEALLAEAEGKKGQMGSELFWTAAGWRDRAIAVVEKHNDHRLEKLRLSSEEVNRGSTSGTSGMRRVEYGTVEEEEVQQRFQLLRINQPPTKQEKCCGLVDPDACCAESPCCRPPGEKVAEDQWDRYAQAGRDAWRADSAQAASTRTGGGINDQAFGRGAPTGDETVMRSPPFFGADGAGAAAAPSQVRMAAASSSSAGRTIDGLQYRGAAQHQHLLGHPHQIDSGNMPPSSWSDDRSSSGDEEEDDSQDTLFGSRISSLSSPASFLRRGKGVGRGRSSAPAENYRNDITRERPIPQSHQHHKHDYYGGSDTTTEQGGSTPFGRRSCCTRENPHCEEGCCVPECCSAIGKSCDRGVQPCTNVALTALCGGVSWVLCGCPARVFCESTRRGFIGQKVVGQDLCDRYFVGATDFDNVRATELPQFVQATAPADERDGAPASTDAGTAPRRPRNETTYTYPWVSGPLTHGSQDVFDSCLGPTAWVCSKGYANCCEGGCSWLKWNLCRGGCKCCWTCLGSTCCGELAAAGKDAQKCCAGVCCRCCGGETTDPEAAATPERQQHMMAPDALLEPAAKVVPPSCLNPCVQCEENPSASSRGLCDTCAHCSCIVCSGLCQDCLGCVKQCATCCSQSYQCCCVNLVFPCCRNSVACVNKCCCEPLTRCCANSCKALGDCLVSCGENCCLPICRCAGQCCVGTGRACADCVAAMPRGALACGAVAAGGACAVGGGWWAWTHLFHHAAATGAAAHGAGGAGAAAAGAGLAA